MAIPLFLHTLLVAAIAAPVASYRQGGVGVAPEGVLPDTWSDKASTVRWRTPLASWSNASPVVVGPTVCVLAEPVTVTCMNADTGAPLWSVDTVVGDALQGEARTAWLAGHTEAVARAQRAEQIQRAYSATRRELRRDPTNTAKVASLDQLGEELRALRTQVDADRHRYFTPDDREVIGYTSQSPVSDGQRIFAQFGHGVVAAFSPKGERLWATYLGPAPDQMRGYHVGTSATPLLHDGMLIVGHGALTALDAATGAVRWKSVPYTDFGSPELAIVGSTAVILTPRGEIVRASDGVVLQTGLPDLWFVGAHVVGQTAYWVGGRTTDRGRTGEPVFAHAWTLSEPSAGKVVATPLWSQPVPGDVRFYTPPTHTDTHILALDDSTTVWRIDRRTGTMTSHPQANLGPGYPAPLVVGGTLLVMGETGAAVLLDPTQPDTVRGRAKASMMRSTPVIVGRRTYLRTLDSLWCVEAAP